MVHALISPGDPSRIAAGVAREFRDLTGRAPAVVTAAPGRVNLIGEHVDYNAGRCLPLAIPHATYAAVAARTDGRLRVTSHHARDTWESSLAGISAGSVDGWAAYVAGVFWALGEAGWDVPGCDVVVESRVPVGAGLSSSAALECSVALAVAAVVGLEDTESVRRTLVAACIRAENEMAGAPTGGIDQTVALLGRAGHALLIDFDEGTDEPLPWAPETQGLDLLVVDTRVTHALADGGYADRRADCETAARELGVARLREAQHSPGVLDRVTDPRVRRRLRHVLTEMDRVDAAAKVLRDGSYDALGPLLDASHDSLRDDFEVSCAELDVAVDTCREAGALGARMTGGGFGGSAIALVTADSLDDTRTAVSEAFVGRGWREPRFVEALASDPARRLR